MTKGIFREKVGMTQIFTRDPIATKLPKRCKPANCWCGYGLAGFLTNTPRSTTTCQRPMAKANTLLSAIREFKHEALGSWIRKLLGHIRSWRCC